MTVPFVIQNLVVNGTACCIGTTIPCIYIINEYLMTDEDDRTLYLSKQVCACGTVYCISTTVLYAQRKMFVD